MECEKELRKLLREGDIANTGKRVSHNDKAICLGQAEGEDLDRKREISAIWPKHKQGNSGEGGKRA